MGAAEPDREQLIKVLKYIRKMYKNPWLRYIIDRTLRNDLEWIKEQEPDGRG